MRSCGDESCSSASTIAANSPRSIRYRGVTVVAPSSAASTPCHPRPDPVAGRVHDRAGVRHAPGDPQVAELVGMLFHHAVDLDSSIERLDVGGLGGHVEAHARDLER